MDHLDLLKQKWQSVEQELPQLSYGDIHQMLLKKSSSIVKWIFLISVGELLFWTILTFFVPESSKTIFLLLKEPPHYFHCFYLSLLQKLSIYCSY